MSDALLEVRGLSKHFGGDPRARRLRHDDQPRRGRGARRRQRRRQDDADQDDLRASSSPTAGEIRLKGEPIHFATPQEARDKGIETIYQDLALADNLSIGANIFLGREPMTQAFGFLPVLDRKAMRKAAQETMALLDFHVSRLDAPVSNFSGGQRQAVAIGRAVHWDAQILIMDEPTAALGVPEQRKVIALIHQLKAQGRGIIFISPQPAGHLRGLRPHHRHAPRHQGRRAPDRRDHPRRGGQADDRRLRCRANP